MTFEPLIHLHYSETLLPMKGGLPKRRDFPGSGDWFPSSRSLRDPRLTTIIFGFMRSLRAWLVTLRRTKRRNHSCYAQMPRLSRDF